MEVSLRGATPSLPASLQEGIPRIYRWNGLHFQGSWGSYRIRRNGAGTGSRARFNDRNSGGESLEGDSKKVDRQMIRRVWLGPRETWSLNNVIYPLPQIFVGAACSFPCETLPCLRSTESRVSIHRYVSVKHSTVRHGLLIISDRLRASRETAGGEEPTEPIATEELVKSIGIWPRLNSLKRKLRARRERFSNTFRVV